METKIEITNQGDVEIGHVSVKCGEGTLQGWWTVVDGKGVGYSQVDVGATRMSRTEATTKLDIALEDYWQGD